MKGLTTSSTLSTMNFGGAVEPAAVDELFKLTFLASTFFAIPFLTAMPLPPFAGVTTTSLTGSTGSFTGIGGANAFNLFAIADPTYFPEKLGSSITPVSVIFSNIYLICFSLYCKVSCCCVKTLSTLIVDKT
jgi:hypothetical protein